jgi:hypothetical protein
MKMTARRPDGCLRTRANPLVLLRHGQGFDKKLRAEDVCLVFRSHKSVTLVTSRRHWRQQRCLRERGFMYGAEDQEPEIVVLAFLQSSRQGGRRGDVDYFGEIALEEMRPLTELCVTFEQSGIICGKRFGKVSVQILILDQDGFC